MLRNIQTSQVCLRTQIQTVIMSFSYCLKCSISFIVDNPKRNMEKMKQKFLPKMPSTASVYLQIQRCLGLDHCHVVK